MMIRKIRHSQSRPFDGLIKTPIKNNPGDMKWILLGTGNPFSGYSREKPANLLLAGEKKILIDCGSGVVRRLLMAGIFPSQISHLFFTHHHADHNSGFIDFFCTSGFSREVPKRKEPLHIYGPANTRQIIGKMQESLEMDLKDRKTFDEDCNKIIYHESMDGLIFNKDNLEINVFTVDHGDFNPSVGFRFSFKNTIIVFSGDTAPCDNIIKYSKNAELLIHESYNTKWIEHTESIYGKSASKVFKDAKNKHTSTLEAAEIAETSNAKHLVLTHHIPSIAPIFSLERDYISGMSKIYSGKITMGRDLMMFYK